MAELRFKLSPTKKLPFKLIGDLTTIGRDPNNSIVIDHPSISPFHAEILLVHSEDRYEVFDLGSPHGTKVNEEQIIRKELTHGDEIKFGHLVAEIIIAVEKDAPDNQLGEKPETKEKRSVAARAASRPPTPKLVKAPPNKKVDPSADEKKSPFIPNIALLKLIASSGFPGTLNSLTFALLLSIFLSDIPNNFLSLANLRTSSFS